MQITASTIKGVEPREERSLRIWAAIAMWLGGGFVMALWTILPGGYPDFIFERRLTAGLCFAIAAFTFAVFPRLPFRRLYAVTNLFSALGAVAVFFACLLSGGAGSIYAELYFFPVLYDAYFFRAKHAAWHLLLISAFTVAPGFYDAEASGSGFATRALVLIALYWGLAAMVGYNKHRMTAAEMAARKLALSDPLTGTHNLRGFHERADASRFESGVGVLLIDVDDFKSINTRCGHTGADRLLQTIARNLQAAAGPEDCVARIGGDEFAVLVRDTNRHEIEKLAASFAGAVRTAGIADIGPACQVSASVGFALAPADGRTFDALMQAADNAMFEVKATHKRGQAPIQSAFVNRGVEAATAATAATNGHCRQNEADDSRRLLSRPWSALEYLRKRPARPTVLAALWLEAAFILAISAIILPTNQHHASLLQLGIAIAISMAAFAFFLADRIGENAYNFSDAVAGATGVLIFYATGGATSPLLPIALLIVVYASQFLSPRAAAVRLLMTIGVFASPFVYSSSDAALSFLVQFTVLDTTAFVLVVIVIYSKQELAREEAKSRELSLRDPLTGLANRRAFDARVGLVLEDGNDHGFTVAIIDLDNFKLVNDRYGHAAGDHALCQIAAGLESAVSNGVFVARIGGDEFAIIAEGLDTLAARTSGDRCIAAVERATGETGFGDCAVSASIGYASYPMHGTTLDELVESADFALMSAKHDGKRRVVTAQNAVRGARA